MRRSTGLFPICTYISAHVMIHSLYIPRTRKEFLTSTWPRFTKRIQRAYECPNSSTIECLILNFLLIYVLGNYDACTCIHEIYDQSKRKIIIVKSMQCFVAIVAPSYYIGHRSGKYFAKMEISLIAICFSAC